jgi:hypothetical protein
VHAQGLEDEVNIYLAPEDPAGRDETAPLQEFYDKIFEHELDFWCPDDSLWPQDRSYSTFCDWFEVTGNSSVWDLGTEPIRFEDLGR